MFIIYAKTGILIGLIIFLFSAIKVFFLFKESDKVSDQEYFSSYHKIIAKYTMIAVLGLAIAKIAEFLWG